MHKELINKLKIQFEQAISYFKGEMAGLQVGRATPSLVENLEVTCYDNQRFPLRELASIQAPEPRMIIVKPWDKEVIKEIESAIRQSSLKLSPVAEEEQIRITIPPLSEERRKELVKILQEKTEEVRISIRRQRGEVWDTIQAMEKNKEIGEDAKFKARDELQKLIDEYNKKIEEMGKKKEEEIMKV